uniref:nuclear transport factor 2 family protein n=1 Tax=Altererythrobacter segetis TaxID=1104773 RepID=UPI00140D057B|nr:nuclear transport factor 2 family protein [Altererythrobacter segetis]
MLGRTMAALAALTLAGCNASVGDKAPDPATQAMLDRVAIQDLVGRYYANFGKSDNHAFEDYFTDDAVLDVNGKVAHGKAEVPGIYAALAGDANPASQGVFHMILSNPVIDVQGDSATATFLWTGVLNDKIDGPPRLWEQGREYDRLVKKDGKWLIKHRVVIADSGLPKSMKDTYTPRMDYDITKD